MAPSLCFVCSSNKWAQVWYQYRTTQRGFWNKIHCRGHNPLINLLCLSQDTHTNTIYSHTHSHVNLEFSIGPNLCLLSMGGNRSSQRKTNTEIEKTGKFCTKSPQSNRDLTQWPSNCAICKYMVLPSFLLPVIMTLLIIVLPFPYLLTSRHFFILSFSFCYTYAENPKWKLHLRTEFMCHCATPGKYFLSQK